MKKKKRWVKFWVVGVLLLLIVFYLHFQNTSIQITNYDITNSSIPTEFNHFKIAQISDFHNTSSKKIQKTLILNLKKEKPNIILITGDFIDSYRTKLEVSIQFLDQIKNIAPIYYVTGNHEARITSYLEFEKDLKSRNVIILNNEKQIIDYKNSKIEIIGLQDPEFYQKKISPMDASYIINSKLKSVIDEKHHFQILLSHRPELFEVYVNNNIDLVFSGHAHGGQIRLPLIGPIFAPSQGLFPKYTNGMHFKNNTTMVISRGIGNSSFPFRVHNRGELIFLQLMKSI